MNRTFQEPPAPAPTIPARPILVVGATGAIGSQVVRALLARGARVRVFFRSLEKVRDLPENVERAAARWRTGKQSPGP